MRAISVKPLGVNGNGKQVVDAFLLADTIPSPLPTTGEGITGLGADCVFAPFSVLYIVSSATTKLYIANEHGQFVAQ